MTYKFYRCGICGCTFSTPYALKRHISDKHKYESTSIDEDKGESSQPKTTYEEEPGIWDEYGLLTEETNLWDEYGLPTEETNLWNYNEKFDVPVVRLR